MKGFITISIEDYNAIKEEVQSIRLGLGDTGRGQFDPSKITSKDMTLSHTVQGLRRLQNNLELN